MNVRKRLALLVVLGASVPLASPAIQAQDVDSEAKPPSLTVSVDVSPRQQESALRFWTKQRVASAKPLRMVSAALTADELAELDLAGSQAVGEPGSSPGGIAEPAADAEAMAAFPAEWAPEADSEATMATEIGPMGTSGVYDSYDLNRTASLQKLYPHRWVGRLSFSTPGGTSTCSATALNGNTIVTAGHCVYDTTANRFYSNWVFQPAYRNGNAPFGTFAATTCWVLTNWVNQAGSYSISWADDDVAVCKMGLSAGRTLNQRVGWSGYEWNWGDIRHVYNMGYPARDFNLTAIPNPAQLLRTCVAETFRYAAEIRGMGCNWGPGISGGPWLRGYQINVVTGWVTGVNSGLFVGQQNMYGARFTTNNITPLCTAAGC